MSKNIIITGASGFVGGNLVNYLLKYNTVPVLKVSRAELRNTSINQNIHTIVHLAGKAHDLKKTSQPEEYYTVNTELSKSVFDAFLNSNAEVFIMMSSVKAVADTVLGSLTERDNPNPQTHYGKSKRLAEEYILSKEIPKGKRVYILRPCMIHGKGNKGNLNLLYSIVKKGIPYPLASFDNERSFLSIDNLCFIINELIQQSDVPSGIYNISDSEPISTNEVISLMGKSLAKKTMIWKINKNIIYTFAKLGDIMKLPLNSERLAKLTENYVVDNNKILSVLNKPLPLTSKEGLMLTLQYFKNEK
jgi:nucleoside-diphosphate-sugar epimerase